MRRGEELSRGPASFLVLLIQRLQNIPGCALARPRLTDKPAQVRQFGTGCSVSRAVIQPAHNVSADGLGLTVVGQEFGVEFLLRQEVDQADVRARLEPTADPQVDGAYAVNDHRRLALVEQFQANRTGNRDARM